MATEKIQLRGGYTEYYLPFGTYKNYTLLVAIANYSTNQACSSSARYMLDDNVSAEDKERRLRSEGGFMQKVCTQDFVAAFKHADSSNRKALIEGLTNNEIEL